MKQLTVSEALTKIECDVAESCMGLDGLKDLLHKAEMYDLASAINAHSRSLERIITDMEFYYRPELGISENHSPSCPHIHTPIANPEGCSSPVCGNVSQDDKENDEAAPASNNLIMIDQNQKPEVTSNDTD